jgi:shikimate kinase
MTTRNRIYLIGFSGAGKSAVGRSAARLLGWRFEDADERIVERAGKPVERIFSEDGEPAFRELERAVIGEFAREERIVVSTGAGSVMHDQSLGGMLGSGLVVALEARPETVYRRLSHIAELDGAEAMARPMLQSDDPLGRIESLKRERQWAYARAHWTVHTDDLTIEQAAHEVVRAWRRLGAPSAWEEDPDLAATVRLEQGAYPVFVGWDTLEDQLGRRLVQTGFSGRAFIVCDSNVVHPYGRAAQRSLHAAGIEMGLFTFPAGEANKSLATATVLYEWLAERRAERRDVIVAVGGTKVESSRKLRNFIGLVRVGEEIEIDVLREQSRVRLSVRVGGEASGEPLGAVDAPPALQGAMLRDLEQGDSAYGRIEGVLAAQVEPGSPAARNGIRPGDIIVAVNRRRVRNAEELESAFDQAGQVLALNIVRGNGQLFIVIR